MKKLLSFMLIAMSVLMLSSCVIVNEEEEDPTYTVFFVNNTKDEYIYDWYLKNSRGKNFTISDNYCPVPINTVSAKGGLDKGDYQIWFCVYSNPNRGAPDVYMHTENYVHINTDVYFTLNDYAFTSVRSASAESDIESDTYVLVDSNGNEYKLVSDN